MTGNDRLLPVAARASSSVRHAYGRSSFFSESSHSIVMSHVSRSPHGTSHDPTSHHRDSQWTYSLLVGVVRMA